MKHPTRFFVVFLAYQLMVFVIRTTLSGSFFSAFFAPISLSGLVIIPIVFSAETKAVRVAKTLLFLVMYIFTDIVVGMCFSFVSGGSPFPAVMDEATISLAIWTYAIAYPTLIAVMLITLPLFGKLSSDNQRNTRIIPFASLALSQSVAMVAVRAIYFYAGGDLFIELGTAFRTFIALATLAWIAIDIVFFIKIEQEAKIQKRLNEQNKLEAYQSAVSSYNERFKSQNDLLHKLRHDLANQILSIRVLAQKGEKVEARNFLGAINAQLAEWSENEEAIFASNEEIEFPSLDSLNAPISSPDRSAVIFGVLSGAATMVALLVFIISASRYGMAPHYIACLLIVMALCLASHVACIRWLRGIQAKRLQILDESVMQQAIEASKQMDVAFQSLKNEKESLRKHLENELSKASLQIDKANTEEALDHIVASLSMIEQALPQKTGNPTLDGILLAKTAQCREQEIQLESQAQVPKELPISDIELGSIAFNLIDNAIAGTASIKMAAQKQSDTDANRASRNIISFSAQIKAGQLLITTSNPCDESLHGELKASPRYAADGTKHGLGTQIISSIAKKHEGIASFSADSGTFTAMVMIPVD